VLDRADVGLDQSRAGQGCVDQQPDVDAVVVLESKAAQQRPARRHDAAERLLEADELEEEGAQSGRAVSVVTRPASREKRAFT